MLRYKHLAHPAKKNYVHNVDQAQNTFNFLSLRVRPRSHAWISTVAIFCDKLPAHLGKDKKGGNFFNTCDRTIFYVMIT